MFQPNDRVTVDLSGLTIQGVSFSQNVQKALGTILEQSESLMPWDKRIEPFLDRYSALRAIGGTPLVPVNVFGDELPEVEVWAKMECLNPGGSLKDRPVLRMLLTALAD